MELAERDAEIISAALNAQGYYNVLCNLIPHSDDNIQAFDTIMFNVKRNNFDFTQEDLTFIKNNLKTSYEKYFDLFFNALQHLWIQSAGGYEIKSYDHHGNLEILLKYTTAKGHCVKVSPKKFEEYARKDAAAKIAANLAKEALIDAMIKEPKKESPIFLA